MEYKNLDLIVKIVLQNEYAKIPTKGTRDSAGYDLYSTENGIIYPNSRVMIGTGISIKLSTGYYGRIAPRSGLAYKNGIDIFGGVIDSDYIGEIKCILYNSGNEPYEYNVGDRIAQLIIEKHYNVDFVKLDELENTSRASGFGSTGI